MSPLRRWVILAVLGAGTVVVGGCVFFLITDFDSNRGLMFTVIGVTLALVSVAYSYRRATRPVPPGEEPRRAAE